MSGITNKEMLQIALLLFAVGTTYGVLSSSVQAEAVKAEANAQAIKSTNKNMNSIRLDVAVIKTDQRNIKNQVSEQSRKIDKILDLMQQNSHLER